jgi:hypothetical protein
LEEEADTFRGVHLDPNAEHWDEVRIYLFSLLIAAALLTMISPKFDIITDGRG